MKRESNKIKNIAARFTLSGVVVCITLAITLIALAFGLGSKILIFIAIALLFLGEASSYFIGLLIYCFAENKDKE